MSQAQGEAVNALELEAAVGMAGKHFADQVGVGRVVFDQKDANVLNTHRLKAGKGGSRRSPDRFLEGEFIVSHEEEKSRSSRTGVAGVERGQRRREWEWNTDKGEESARDQRRKGPAKTSADEGGRAEKEIGRQDQVGEILSGKAGVFDRRPWSGALRMTAKRTGAGTRSYLGGWEAKYCSRPAVICCRPAWTLRVRASTTAETSLDWTGSSWE